MTLEAGEGTNIKGIEINLLGRHRSASQRPHPRLRTLSRQTIHQIDIKHGKMQLPVGAPKPSAPRYSFVRGAAAATSASTKLCTPMLTLADAKRLQHAQSSISAASPRQVSTEKGESIRDQMENTRVISGEAAPAGLPEDQLACRHRSLLWPPAMLQSPRGHRRLFERAPRCADQRIIRVGPVVTSCRSHIASRRTGCGRCRNTHPSAPAPGDIRQRTPGLQRDRRFCAGRNRYTSVGARRVFQLRQAYDDWGSRRSWFNRQSRRRGTAQMTRWASDARQNLPLRTPSHGRCTGPPVRPPCFHSLKQQPSHRST